MYTVCHVVRLSRSLLPSPYTIARLVQRFRFANPSSAPSPPSASKDPPPLPLEQPPLDGGSGQHTVLPDCAVRQL
jgi:hypothetical protein